MPQTPHDESSSSPADQPTVTPGPDTTSAQSAAQDDGASPAPTPDASRREILATLGRDRGGRTVYLAHESPTGSAGAQASDASLLVLTAPSVHTDTPGSAEVRVLEGHGIEVASTCYACATPRDDAVRYCEVCGARLSIAVPGAGAAESARAGRQVVESALRDQLALVGTMPTVEGGTFYFARERQPDSVLLAFVPRASGSDADEPDECVLDAMPALDVIEPTLRTAQPRPAPGPGSEGDASPDAETRVPDPTVPPTIAAPEEPLVGRLLDGKYRIMRLLGQGGMGRVFDARHEQLHARRAIKVMHPHLESRSDLVARFYEEARNAARVRHPHVCTVHDFGLADGLIYIAMEFVEGEALADLLKREGRLGPARVADIIGQTAEALDAAHALKIIHRDVKPDNIMMCRRDDGRDEVQVVDFGISKALNRSELTMPGTDTKYGMVVGTLDYMSDEQRHGLEVDHRTDVYALGRTAVKMLYGKLPEHGAWNEWSRDRVSDELRTVLSRALAPREERYGSAGEFARELARVLATLPDPAVPRSFVSRAMDALERRRRLVAGIAAAALAAVVVTAIVRAALRPGPGPSDPDSVAVPVATIDAAPSAIRFEIDDRTRVAPSDTVRIARSSGIDVAGLTVGTVRYDGAVVGWLDGATWRRGDSTTPALLVLTPRLGVAPPGTHTARVPIVSPASPTALATVAVTLVVTEPRPCTPPLDELARLKRLTDPIAGTEEDARRVVTLVPGLLPELCTDDQRVEAQLRLAEAHMTLRQTSRACAVLRRIETLAQPTSFAQNVALYLSRCP